MKSISELIPKNFNELQHLLKKLATTSELPSTDVTLVTDATGDSYIKLSVPPQTNAQQIANTFSTDSFTYLIENNSIFIIAIDSKLISPPVSENRRGEKRRRGQLFAEPKSLREEFICSYHNELKGQAKGDLTAEEKKQLMIAKFAGLILVERLEKLKAKEKLLLSYAGRGPSSLNSAHQSFFVQSQFINIDTISRLHFAILESRTGERVLIDLGSRSGTRVMFLDEVSAPEYNTVNTWMTKLFASAKESLPSQEQAESASVNNSQQLKNDYATICPVFQTIQTEVLAYIESAATETTKPKANEQVALVTGSKGIGWIPIPKNYRYEVEVGPSTFNINPTVLQAEEAITPPWQSPNI